MIPGSFGQVQVSGVWLLPGATVLRVDGQIGGRRVVVEVPATSSSHAPLRIGRPAFELVDLAPGLDAAGRDQEGIKT